MNENVKVAISADFLTAFAALPRQIQGKVTEFINKFRRLKVALIRKSVLFGSTIHTEELLPARKKVVFICFYGLTIMTKLMNGQQESAARSILRLMRFRCLRSSSR